MSVAAFADVTNTATPTATSDAVNQGNNQSVAFVSPADIKQTIKYDGTYTLKNVPSVNGPPLTTSNDTCMGSASGSFNIAGLGLGAGSTYVDENCKRLKNSRELWNMGMKAASLALMCNDKENQEALTLTGYECPQIARHSPQSTEKYTDPIVRERLGLPVLK